MQRAELAVKELDSIGMKRIDDIVIKQREVVLPCYEMNGFINSVEGWNLFVKLRTAK